MKLYPITLCPISFKSLQTFLLLNSFLTFLALFQQACIEYEIEYYNYNLHIFKAFFIFILRNYTLLYFVDYISSNKPKISNDKSLLPKELYKHEFDINLIMSSGVESITHSVINSIYLFKDDNIGSDLIYFIPISFLFEIIFDLFHYIGHRTLHNKYLYKYSHKKHHKFKYPTSIITFYQDPIDIILTNSVPIILTLSIVPKLSYFQFSLIIIYKTYSEIGGHFGKKSYPTGSFCQFIWLPRLLNIELYSEDHHLHHSLNNCNYSKRFSLWDKLFGTFISSKTSN